MNPNIRLTIIFSSAIFIVVFFISFNKLDPFYKTNSTIPAKIIHLVYATGKSGARIEVTVETINGEQFWFKKSVSYSGRAGEKVKLRVYERKLTGLKKYELE